MPETRCYHRRTVLRGQHLFRLAERFCSHHTVLSKNDGLRVLGEVVRKVNLRFGFCYAVLYWSSFEQAREEINK